MDPDPQTPPRAPGAMAWLRSDVTVTLPGWAVAAAGAAVVLLAVVALD